MAAVVWISDWFLAVFTAAATIRKLREANTILELSVKLEKSEQASLQRQLTSAIDTIQAFGLHNRVIGMEAKILEADLISRTTGQQQGN